MVNNGLVNHYSKILGCGIVAIGWVLLFGSPPRLGSPGAWPVAGYFIAALLLGGGVLSLLIEALLYRCFGPESGDPD